MEKTARQSMILSYHLLRSKWIFDCSQRDMPMDQEEHCCLVDRESLLPKFLLLTAQGLIHIAIPIRRTQRNLVTQLLPLAN